MNYMIEFTFPIIGRALILIAICAWATLLSHKCISNFNDGARSVFPELMEGRMSRKEFAIIIFGMGISWIIVGFSQWLGYGLVSCYLTLIAADILGAFAPNKWLAICFGLLWGAVCFFGTAGLNTLFDALPYNFLSDLKNISAPTLPILCMYPAITIANQFNTKKGIIVGIIQVVVYIICSVVGKINFGIFEISLYPYAFTMLTGMIMFVIYFACSKNEETIEVSKEENDLFSKNILRIKNNWPYLCVQGALNALGIATLSQVYQQAVLSAALQIDNILVFKITMIGVIASFIPIVVSTSLSTGVYQTVGLTSCMLVGSFFIGKLWFLAPIAGFIIEFIEICSLEFLKSLLTKFPKLSQTGDYIRNAMVSCTSLALCIGSFLAANVIWKDIGLCIVGGFYVINDAIGQKVPRIAVGPVAVVIVGILYNLIIVCGLVGLKG